MLEHPAGRLALELDRCGDIQQHALSEERLEFRGGRAGQLAHPPVKSAELLADHLLDVRV